MSAHFVGVSSEDNEKRGNGRGIRVPSCALLADSLWFLGKMKSDLLEIPWLHFCLV